MEETVEAFSKARTIALNLARDQGNRSQSPKRKAVEISSDAHEPHEPKRLRTSARLNKSRGEQPVIAIPVQEVEDQIVPDSNNDDDDEEYVPEARKSRDTSTSSTTLLTIHSFSQRPRSLPLLQQKDERVAGVWTFRILSRPVSSKQFKQYCQLRHCVFLWTVSSETAKDARKATSPQLFHVERTSTEEENGGLGHL